MKLRMIDQIIAWEANRSISGVKAVSFEEYCMRAALGERECLPESLALQSTCELAGWLMILSSDFARMGMMMGFERAEFTAPLGPVERMIVSANVRQSESELVLFDGAGQVSSRRIFQVEGLRMLPVPLQDYSDPADLRVLFSEIRRPAVEGAT